MADAWIARIDQYENGQTEESNQPKTPTTQPDIPKGTTIPGVGYVESGNTSPYSQAEEERYTRGIVAAIKELIPPLKETNEPTELTPAQQQKMYGGSGSEPNKTDEPNNNLQEAATKLQEGGTQIETAATKLETGASKVEKAASKLETAATDLSKPKGLKGSNSAKF